MVPYRGELKEDGKMPATVQQLLDSADAMWAAWSYPTWNLITEAHDIPHDDKDKVYATIVRDVYCHELGEKKKPSLDRIMEDDYAWSASGMSYLLREGGLTEDEFPFHQSHHHFIRRAIAARKQNHDWTFWGYRHGENGGQPQVGDLVAYVRNDTITWKQAKLFFDVDNGYNSHTDIVVEVRPGEIDVIGANVANSVTKKTLALDTAGHIANTTTKTFHWFTTLRYMGG